MQAVDEADLLVFVVDGRAGVSGLDEEIAGILRKSDRPVLLAVNKVDGAEQESPTGDVYRLGFTPVLTISAEHGRGVAELLEACRDLAPRGRCRRRGPRARGWPSSAGPTWASRRW